MNVVVKSSLFFLHSFGVSLWSWWRGGRKVEVMAAKFAADERFHAFLHARLFAMAHKDQLSGYISSQDSSLPVDLQVLQDGSVIIYLENESLGEGSFKKVAKAVDIFSGKIFAFAKWIKIEKYQAERQKEITSLEVFSGKKGFIQLFSVPKEGVLLFKFCNEGNLSGKMHNLSLQEKKWIFEDLVRAVAHMHDLGYVHRDLKPDNILLHKADRLEAVISDLGTLCLCSENDGLVVTTSWYASPEYAKAYIDRQPLSPFMKKEHDVWALGLILSSLLGVHFSLRVTNYKKELEAVLAMPAMDEPADKRSPLHLAWRMRQIDPNQRIKAVEALELLPFLEWPIDG